MSSGKERVRFALEHMKDRIRIIKFSYYPFVIYDCMPNRPFAFSNVNLSLEYFHDAFKGQCPFVQSSILMKPGIRLLEDYLEKSEDNIPSRFKPELQCLLSFLAETDYHGECLQRLMTMQDQVDTKSTVGLAVHLFSKLYPNGGFLLDEHMFKDWNKKECTCGCETRVEDNTFGHTGLGNPEVWHGCTDVMLQSRFIVPTLTVTEELTHRFRQSSLSDDGETSELSEDCVIPDEVEMSGRCKSVLDHDKVTSQIIAQTIVNSFANAAKSSNEGSSIFPALGSTLDKVAVYFYDTDKDLLIARGTHINIWKEDGTLSDVAILELWLILNFQPVLPKSALTSFPKSNFRTHVSAKALECYKASKTCVSVTDMSNEGSKYLREQYSMAPLKFESCVFKECDDG